jgi:hypothetical protein
MIDLRENFWLGRGFSRKYAEFLGYEIKTDFSAFIGARLRLINP